MSDLSKNTEIKLDLNGQPFEGLIELNDVKIVAEYTDDNIQPSLEIENLTFTDEGRVKINEHIENGLTGGVGIFEGLPFDFTLFNNEPVQKTFKSFIDYTNGYRDLLQDGKVDVSTMPDDGVGNFFDQLGVLTFGLLESEGIIKKSDSENVSYVVEKKFNLIEILTTSILLYMMIKELVESIERTANAIADVVSLSLASLVAAPAAAILAVFKAIIAAAYTAIMIIAIINLGRTLINSLVPPARIHKVISVRRLLERACEKLGYTLDAPIDELNFLSYLPSNPRMDDKTLFGFIDKPHGTPTGVPNSLDGGWYNCAEAFQRVKDIFRAKIAIVNKVVIIRPKIDPFWQQQSSYVMPSVELQQKEFNTDELKASRILSFEVDLNDDWTIDNKVGRAFEIHTEPKTIINKNAVLLKGLEDLNFRACIGTRKDKLNAIENLLAAVGGFIDGLTNVFGSGTNFAGQVKGKVGVLKQSNNWHSIPKLLYLKNNRIPTNARDLFSAELLYFKYHKESSFVLDSGIGQKVVYNGVRVGFGFEDYKILLENSFFKFRGQDAKITRFEWTLGQDFAIVNFWIRSKYTDNLKETYIDLSE